MRFTQLTIAGAALSIAALGSAPAFARAQFDASAADVSPQPPPGRGGQPPTQAPPQQPGGPGGGGQNRRAPIQVMTLTTTAWPDGGLIPAKHSQAGKDVSPPLAWSGSPDDAVSFVIVAHDIDALAGNGDDMLHWLLWNIPKTVTSIHEGAPALWQLPDGTRQMSGTGPYYRGPAAPATGSAHHYVFEVYALDAMLDVVATGQNPGVTRAAVMTAMAGHIRGKGAMVGLYKK